MNTRTSIPFIMLCCLPLLAACGGQKQEMPGEKYKTLTVTTTDQTLQSTYPATLRGRQAVEIRPQVSGTITQICINEGDAVRRGQILFIIDQVPYKAALETALANVKSAEAKLETAKLTANSKEELYKEKVVSDFDRQTARNQLLEAEAALAQAKAEETNARNNLSYTEVKSPVDGVAGMIPYRVGALVSSSISEPLVTVSDDAEIYAYFSMAESQMLDLIQQYGSLEEACRQMPSVGLTLSNGKAYAEQGRIDAISGTVDESTGGVTLRAVFLIVVTCCVTEEVELFLCRPSIKIASPFRKALLMNCKIVCSRGKWSRGRRNPPLLPFINTMTDRPTLCCRACKQAMLLLPKVPG